MNVEKVRRWRYRESSVFGNYEWLLLRVVALAVSDVMHRREGYAEEAEAFLWATCPSVMEELLRE